MTKLYTKNCKAQSDKYPNLTQTVPLLEVMYVRIIFLVNNISPKTTIKALFIDGI